MPSRTMTREETHIIEETIEFDTEREEQLDAREQELDDRESQHWLRLSEFEHQENELQERQRQLAQSVSTWTGIPIPVDEPIDQYLSSFDWSAMPIPEGFVDDDDQASEPATPYQGEDMRDEDMSEPEIHGSDISENGDRPFELEDPFIDHSPATPTPAPRLGELGIPGMQQRLRTQPAKRKRETGPDADDGDHAKERHSAKKVKEVIDLTMD